MKKAFIVSVVFAAFALIQLIYALVILTPCYKTKAVVDFIGMPQGNVFGSFTDESGAMHEEEMIFRTLLLGGDFIDLETVEQYYGEKISISIHPHNGKIYYAPHLYATALPFAVISLVSAVIGAVKRKINTSKKNKRKEHDKS